MFILKKKAMVFLNKYLNLPSEGNEQDWDLELASSDRLKEFLDAYNYNFNNDVQLALIALIFASYDEYLNEHKRNPSIDERIRKIVNTNKKNFHGLLKYWASEENKNPKHGFKVTLLARDILLATKD